MNEKVQKHDDSTVKQAKRHGITNLTLGIFMILCGIACFIVVGVKKDSPLMRLTTQLEQNVFIKRLTMYTIFSSREGPGFWGGIVVAFMFVVSGVVACLNGLDYMYKGSQKLSKVSSSSSKSAISGWSRFFTIIGYSMVLAMGFLVPSSVMGQLEVFDMVISFVVIFVSSSVFSLTQASFNSLGVDSSTWFDNWLAPSMAAVFQVFPPLYLIIQCSNFMQNSPAITLSNSGLALVIGYFVFSFLYYAPLMMSIYSKVKWVWIDTTFTVYILAFNIYIAVTFFLYAT